MTKQEILDYFSLIDFAYNESGRLESLSRMIDELLKEQEAENGEWITIWQEDDPDTSIHGRCSICNRISERPLGVYCKWCGTKMNKE